jgi:UDP-glucose 4-epimerase
MVSSKAGLKGKKVLVTGGLGFIGSNLSSRLVGLGAEVTIVDNMMPRLGGNLFNVSEIADRVHINFSDIRDSHSMDYLVKGQELIFHLAGQVNHVDSIRNPIQDLAINCQGTLVLLESCRRYNREVRIIFAGTRGEYGASVKLPVREDHPTNPKGIYAVTNLTAEKMVLVYHDVHKIPGACLRITNTYGPRHQMAHDEYGVLNWFIRKAIDDEVIPVFGDGRILRDFLYVDDLVGCFIETATCDGSYGEVFNVGTGVPINFVDLAKKIVKITGKGKVAFTEFTQERKEVEPGDYYTDISKIKRVVGWQPRTDFDEGLRKTISFYRKHKKEYWG